MFQLRFLGSTKGLNMNKNLLTFLFFIAFSTAGCAAKSTTEVGLMSNKLAACSSKPNCVSSEHDEGDSHFIAPISIDAGTTAGVTIKELKQVLLNMGANVTVEQDAYIAATFTSRFLRFVDDFEVRIDQQNSLVHIRSASRTGYSDFGVNRKRAERFKAELLSVLK